MEGITYLGVYYDYIEGSGVENGIIDIKGNEGLEGAYSASSEQVVALFY